MDKIEFLEWSLERQLGWIQAADGRLSLLLPLATAMIAAMAAFVPKVEYWTVSALCTGTLAGLLLLLCVLFCGFSAIPRTKGPRGSLVFFGGIAERAREEFTKAIADAKEQALLEDLAWQCHVNAKIASEKFGWVKAAMICLLASVLPWAVTILLLYSSDS